MTPIYSRRVRHFGGQRGGSLWQGAAKIPGMALVEFLETATSTTQTQTKGTTLKERHSEEKESFLIVDELAKRAIVIMSTATIIPGSKPVINPMLDLFKVPPTDFSIASRRKVPVHPFTTGITPVDFQIDPQSEYIDLSQSEFELELKLKKADGTRLTDGCNLQHLPGQQFCPLALQADQRAIQQHAHQSPDGHVRLQGDDRHGIEL